ncbi:MAG: DUF937 domain-containing protein [Cyanobacteria bacterium J06626_18]
MGLFDQVVSAINDPDKQASASQIGQVFSAVQQMGQQNNTSPDAMQTAASVLGSYMRSSLKETRNSQGEAAVQTLVQRGTQSGLAGQVLGQLLNSGQQAQVVQAISQKTGMNANQIQAMLPMLVPVVMQMLNSGSSRQGAPTGNNPVLSAFLDSDGDGDVDMGDMLRMASRFTG